MQPIDGSRPAFNISRHPYNDSDPVWSPDGKIIAFLGARDRKDNIDIHYVYLQKKEDQQSPRDRLIQKAKQLGPLGVPGKSGKGKGGDPTKKNNDNPEQIGKENKENGNNPESKKGKNTESMYPKIEIDFDHLHDRIHRITIANSNERSLFWSADSKKLAFTATVDGNTGTYTLEIPEGTRPVLLSSQVGSQAKWLKNNRIVWLSAGIPGSISGGGGTALTTTPPTTSPIGPRLGGPGGRGGRGQLSAGNATATTGGYRFTVYQELDLAKRNQAAFDMCWRIMRDQWYDERLGNRDWNRIRQKYLAASETPSLETLSTVIYLMLGELNGSHLGFSTTTGRGGPRRGMPASTPIGGNRNWSMRTAHLGVHFDPTHGGKGLRIEYVIPGGPADQEKSKLKIGEIILTIDGHEVMGDIDLTQILNGVLPRDIVLEVRDNEEKVRKVTLRAVDYAAIPPLLYQTWVQKNLKEVEVLSQGQLGYLHIRGMDMPSFQKFEEELYNAGAGKNGLIIDVRENGGGFTTDLLLTALTQPKHSITIPRGGRPGYPQDRTIYANELVVIEAEENKQHQGMGCTLEVLWCCGNRALIGHIGDSRIYLVREGQLKLLTEDQTLVGFLHQAGFLTAEEVLDHPQRNELYQAIGRRENFEPYVQSFELQLRDRILICSDGLSNQLTENRIFTILKKSSSPEKAARRLINVANRLGATDNVTAIVLFVS